MRLNVQVTLPQTHDFPPCPVSVVGEVWRQGHQIRLCFDSIQDTEAGTFWSRLDIEDMDQDDREDIATALIKAFDAATNGHAQLVEEAAYLSALLRTHVEVALESGTAAALIQSFLSEVRTLVLSPRKATP